MKPIDKYLIGKTMQQAIINGFSMRVQVCSSDWNWVQIFYMLMSENYIYCLFSQLTLEFLMNGKELFFDFDVTEWKVRCRLNIVAKIIYSRS